MTGQGKWIQVMGGRMSTDDMLVSSSPTANQHTISSDVQTNHRTWVEIPAVSELLSAVEEQAMVSKIQLAYGESFNLVRSGFPKSGMVKYSPLERWQLGRDRYR